MIDFEGLFSCQVDAINTFTSDLNEVSESLDTTEDPDAAQSLETGTYYACASTGHNSCMLYGPKYSQGFPHYSPIMPTDFLCLLCSKLCRHNCLRPSAQKHNRENL